jgi:hypothetical protein
MTTGGREPGTAVEPRLAALIIAAESPAGFVSRDDPTLRSGLAGLALLRHEASRVGLGQRRQVLEALQQALAAYETAPGDASLHTGLAGIGWVAWEVAREESHELCGEIDRELYELLAQNPAERLRWDVQGGIAGYLAYALSRLSQPGAWPLAELAVRRLVEIARPGASTSGRVLWTAPAGVVDSSAETLAALQAGASYADFTAPHGIPGVLPVLAESARLGVLPSLARSLCGELIEFVQAVAKPASTRRWDLGRVGGRWAGQALYAPCQGDPAVVACVLWAAHALGDARSLAWATATLELVAAESMRAPACENEYVSLCCGSAGLAVLFSAAADLGAGAQVEKAAQFWRQRLRQQHQPGRGAYGYGGPGGVTLGAGVHYGGFGPALALLASDSATPPRWAGLFGLAPLSSRPG